MKRTIQLPVVFDSANRKKDGSLSLKLTTTEEIPNAEFAIIDLSVRTEGWFLYSENAFTDAQVPTVDAPSDTKKPSVRLRGVLFRLWEHETDQSEDFDSYYRRRMESFIDHVKAKLA